MKKFETRDIVLIAMYVALAIVLDYVKEFLPFLNMPQGGSLNIALIPIVIGSFHLGFGYGALIGLLWWGVSSLMGLNNDIVSPMQYVLDYIVPSVIIGLSSIFYRTSDDSKMKLIKMEVGIFLMMAIRTASICISGAYFWPGDAAAGSLAAWSGSLAYNLPYCIATGVMLMVLVPLAMTRIKTLIK